MSILNCRNRLAAAIRLRPVECRRLTKAALGNLRSQRPVHLDSVAQRTDAAFGDVFGVPPIVTRWAIVDPGPF
jgi:hypothetical protein